MSFTNEYVTDADIKEYQLVTLWQEALVSKNWHPTQRYKFLWTIDKTRKVFISRLRFVTKEGLSGREEYTGEEQFIYYNNGMYGRFTIKHSNDTSIFNDEPGNKIVWELVSKDNNIDDSIINDIKKALKVHGYLGAFKQLPSTEVFFNF